MQIFCDWGSKDEKSFCMFVYIFACSFTYLRVCLHFCLFVYIFSGVNHKALILHGQVYNANLADHADFIELTSVVLRVRVLGFHIGQT